MFWEQFWPQLIATIIGIAIGIPVALWISGFQEKRTEKERKKKILSALRNELEINQAHLSEFILSLEHSKKYHMVLMREETWRAFSDGGELKWIKDTELLNSLANVYFSIKRLVFYNEKYWEEIQIYFISKETEMDEFIKARKGDLGNLVDDLEKEFQDILKLI